MAYREVFGVSLPPPTPSSIVGKCFGMQQTVRSKFPIFPRAPHQRNMIGSNISFDLNTKLLSAFLGFLANNKHKIFRCDVRERDKKISLKWIVSLNNFSTLEA